MRNKSEIKVVRKSCCLTCVTIGENKLTVGRCNVWIELLQRTDPGSSISGVSPFPRNNNKAVKHTNASRIPCSALPFHSVRLTSNNNNNNNKAVKHTNASRIPCSALPFHSVRLTCRRGSLRSRTQILLFARGLTTILLALAEGGGDRTEREAHPVHVRYNDNGITIE